MRRFFRSFLLFLALLLSAALVCSGPAALAGQVVTVRTVEITPANVEVVVGQKVQFKAVGRDQSGNPVDLKPSAWLAGPSDLVGIDENGLATFYSPGETRVGAMVGGATGYAPVVIKPAPVARVVIAPPPAPLVVGGVSELEAGAFSSNGDPRSDTPVEWSSEDPSIVTVDAAGMLRGIRPGSTNVRASAGPVSTTISITVVANPVRSLSVEPGSVKARAGDVVRFTVKASDEAGARVENPSVRWAVSGEGAMIESDGGFVAERPGTYVITAASGERSAVASVVVSPRNVEREVEVVGRATLKDGANEDIQTAEQWIIGNYAYLSTIADEVRVYDISNPASPKLTETLDIDARLINDISTTSDGRVLVISKEGAADRRNGITFFDTSDPAHPKMVSEYTETVTGGVHSAFVDKHYVYLTDDATGSLRVIDFKDVKAPKEVARWQVENSVAQPFVSFGGQNMSGRYLHDVQVKDGLAYLAYWRDGLVILDVGNGMKGGKPESPQLVSQLRFNHHELYGNGWTAGTHTVFRYKNYVFVGDEVLPGDYDILSKDRFATRGIVHVIDVSDISKPRKVAEYPVPEAGSHNIWVENDVLYMGYYNGGGRILDVSGELRGDLYRQGREIARVWTGAPEGFRSNNPLAWGAQPHNGVIYFNDINTGLWIVKLGKPKDKGSTTSTGY